MSLETDLARTFAEHEHLAPDEERVLAAVRDRTGGRRPAVRPWAVAATVVAMAVVAGGAVAVASADRDAPTQVAGSDAPTPVAGSSSSSPSPVTTTGSATATPAALTMPFDVEWLPEGTVEYLARRTQLGVSAGSGQAVVDGEYLLTVTSASRALDVDVQEMPGGLEGAAFKSGAGADVTIGGRPAVESVHADGPGGYEVYFLGPGGRLTYVNVANSPGTTSPQAGAEELRTTGRRVAESVVLPGTTQLQPDFGVGHVPAGLEIRTFEVAPDDGPTPTTDPTPTGLTRTSYGLGGPSASDTPVAIVGGTLPTGGAPTVPGRPVQGHPTTLADDAGYRTLVVHDVLDGRTIAVSGEVGADELYRIADGLVLPD